MINVRMPEEETQLSPRIVVVGVGGGGGNAVNNMIQSNLEGVEFLVCNTDAQALKNNLADRKTQLGVNITRGLGGGACPDIGRAAAEETIDDIVGYLDGANMVFITAGMGGATGTGAAPVIARAAREMGILTVGVVTKPFHFEGKHRMRVAEEGIEELQQYVDTLLIIPNQNLFRIANDKTTFADAFRMADDVLHSGVRGVTDLIVMPGLINLDFADIRSIMAEMGKAMMGTGEAEGDGRAIDAAEAAISNPLLEDVSMKGARGVLINITGGMDMTLFEVDEACNRIREEVDEDANIIFGSTFDENLEGIMRVSVVATGIDGALQGQIPTRGSSIRQSTPQSRPTNDQPAPSAPSTGTFGQQQQTTQASAPSAPTGNGYAEQKPAEAPAPTASASVKENQTDFFTAPKAAETTETETEIRGETESDNSFIPPKPVIAEEQPVYAQAPSEPTQNQSAPTEAASSTNTGNEADDRKAAGVSLFDRLTGRTPEKTAKESEEPEEIAKAPLTATRSTHESGLEIHQSEQSLTASSDEDLDIPAFLRRQAN